MFKRIVNVVGVLALLGAAVFVVLLFANEPGSGGGASSGSSGKSLFAANCATCHGPDGQGAVGPQLAGRMTQQFPDIDDQIKIVADGNGGMPSFAGKLSSQQIRAVVDYTRTGLTG